MIKPTKDYEMIKKMLLEDKELFDRISDDFTDPDKFDPSNSEWVGYFDGDICKGLMSIDKDGGSAIYVHINIPIAYRGAESFKIGNSLLKYVELNSDKRYIKVNAKIPELHIDVIKFAIKNGFTVEGIDYRSYVKDGKIYNRFMLGKIIER